MPSTPGAGEGHPEQRRAQIRSRGRHRWQVPNPSGMTSRTTVPTKAQDIGRKEHGRSGSSAIPTTTASWVGQLDCYIWGRRTCELFHRAHTQNILTYFAALTPPQSPKVCRSRGLDGISFFTSKTASLYVHLACSRHCETIFHRSTPSGLPFAQARPQIPRNATIVERGNPGYFGLQKSVTPIPRLPATLPFHHRPQA